jgi:hypothetical protein
MRLFLSYAHEDKQTVRQLSDLLQDGGHNPWFDHWLLIGKQWKQELEKELRECDAFVYAISQHSLASEWCRWELEQAIKLRKPVIPIVLEKGLALPPSLLDYQYIDLSEEPSPQTIARLMRGLYAAQTPRRRSSRLWMWGLALLVVVVAGLALFASYVRTNQAASADLTDTQAAIAAFSTATVAGDLTAQALTLASDVQKTAAAQGNTGDSQGLTRTAMFQAFLASTSTFVPFFETITAEASQTAQANHTPTEVSTATPLPTERPTATAAASPTTTPDRPYATVIDIEANVRVGDSINYPIIASFQPDTQLPIIAISATGSGWYQVELPAESERRVGWLAPSTVSVSGDVSQLPYRSPPPAATATFSS